jgi:hypothetical protein
VTFNSALGSHSRLCLGAYAAARWAFIFATFHVIWAAGAYPLLDAEQARVAFATPKPAHRDQIASLEDWPLLRLAAMGI